MTYEEWKKAGMVLNRFTVVNRHYRLKQQILEASNIQDIRGILNELLNSTIPLDSDEIRVWSNSNE